VAQASHSFIKGSKKRLICVAFDARRGLFIRFPCPRFPQFQDGVAMAVAQPVRWVGTDLPETAELFRKNNILLGNRCDSGVRVAVLDKCAKCRI
jgi:hypothetical protein